jgi:hypothetical protein
MAAKPSVKAQVGRGLLIAGVILAVPGAIALIQGGEPSALLLEIIPAALVVAGIRMKGSGSRDHRAV